MIYFDNAATTPICDTALKTLLEKSALVFGNPSARYGLGFQAKQAINQARKEIASYLNCGAEDLFFTSGGTESNNIIIRSLIEQQNEPMHIICSSIEHESVLNALKAVSKEGISITYIHPDTAGIIQPETIEKAFRPNTKLVLVQLINNELGTIQPIKEISELCHIHQAHFHTDAVQAVGHIAIDIKALGIDSLSASGHKFSAPKGIGFLFSRKHNIGLCYGGGQEKGVKSGTENVPPICAMSAALADSLQDLDSKKKHISEMIAFLTASLAKNKSIGFNVPVQGYRSIISFRINGISNEAIINYLDLKGICVSSGSACSGNSFERSHVLKSLGLESEVIDSTIRVSLSPTNTLEECRTFVAVLEEAIQKIRGVK